MKTKEDLFDATLAIRNFEIDLFWRRSNYFLVLNTAIAIAFFTIKVEDYKIYVSALGLIVCILWFLINLGSKFWQDRWEYQLYLIEKDIANFPYKLFSANRSELKNLVQASLHLNQHNWPRRQFDKLILWRLPVSFIMILLSLLFIIFWTLFFLADLKINWNFNMDSHIIQSADASAENLYWLFSSAAQSISAFIALLLTGFTFVLTVISNMEQKDESLAEILHRIRVIYFRNIIILSIVTGFAIVSSLYSVYINPFNMEYKPLIQIGASVLDFIAIFGGIIFVLFIINPNKYRNIANKLYLEEKEKIKPTGEDIDKIEFIQVFIELEKLFRDILEKRDLYIESKYLKREFYSFRIMLDILLNNKLIDKSFYSSLLELNSIRNLVVHGKRDTVDKKMLTLVSEAEAKLKELKGTI